MSGHVNMLHRCSVLLDKTAEGGDDPAIKRVAQLWKRQVDMELNAVSKAREVRPIFSQRQSS